MTIGSTDGAIAWTPTLAVTSHRPTSAGEIDADHFLKK
jgi:hypothetical protein